MSTDARLRALADWVWYADGAGAATVRSLLSPAAWVFAAGVARRNARFDRALLPSAASDVALPSMPIPAMSVGNLTVGGTGKTPVASWFVARLIERGAHPALVLRGYGDDEWRVHERLTPDAPVIVNPDRVLGAREASARGADCVVLDDAFQHRRARRVSDVVLLSADQWQPGARVLPAGPYRERYTALGRATAVVVTVKAADEGVVSNVERMAEQHVEASRVAVVQLASTGLRSALGESLAPSLNGLRIVAVSAIGNPSAFEQQLLAAGAVVGDHLRYADHHQFTSGEVSEMVRVAERGDGVVCTLKDAVKLGPLWPRVGPTLWYLSQTVVVLRGAEVLERECDRVLAARRATIPTAG
jgi:tetraacyldisaccharide 4'-kinase